MLRYVRRNDIPTEFERPSDMPEALSRLLCARGVESAEAAEAFLRPGARSLHDPTLLSDMAEAADRIRRAVAEGEPVCVYGDYDVDGVCATAILLTWLRAKGADARAYLPSRHAEGYGLNADAIREIAGWARLMVTVDCGVTSVELVALAKSLGLTVIVTDHHRPVEAANAAAELSAMGRVSGGFLLPDCPVVNPLLDGYPFPHLCGAGVAWKLVWALSGGMPADLVDIAALATVADVVSLTGENRAIVRMGLDAVNRAARPGLSALIDVAGLSGKPVTSTGIAFQLAPRLNAGGRLGSAMRALELVTAEDPARAQALAEELEDENRRRRQVEQQILADAQAQLRDFDFIAHRALILSGKDWNPGVIGLAASRLVEQYHYPVVMLSDQGEKMTGSCRSIPGVDIHAALVGCAEHLVKFGGHRQAAGLTLAPEKLGDFIAAMDAWLSANVDPSAWIPVREYDTEMDFGDVTPGLIAALDALQPTGFGNPAPVFRAEAEVLEARAVGAEGAHLKLMLAQGGRRLDAIAFQEGWQAKRFNGADPEANRVDALFVPRLNAYMGRISAQLEVRALSDADAHARIAAKLDDEIALQCDFLTEIFYNGFHHPEDGGEAIAPRRIDIRELEAWVRQRPQGTLVVAGDLAAASRLMRELDGVDLDLCLGAMPEDPRAFNALSVCPAGGGIPRSYRRVVLAGAPPECLRGLPEGAEAFALDMRPGWMRRLPDIEQMRRVYRALMELSRRPVRFHDRKQLAMLVEENTGVGMIAALASVLAIEDMGLFSIDLDHSPARIVRLDRKKADPDASAVWRAIQRWREGEP